MRAIFCGNFEYDARQSELERLFRKYGKVDRVDMKSGFAFVYMEDERDAEDAIRGLDRFEFGRKGRRLRVEWTKQERGSSRRIESSRRPAANTRPSKTLFVINFDPYHTRTADLERHFDPYGKILNIRIRKNFAFIHYESLEDATRALDATNYSKLMDRVITVEYAIRDDDDKGNGHSPHRSIDRSPRRGGYNRGRSPSPYGRQRGSPDYGYGRRGRSPSPYGRERGSPDYGYGPRRPILSPNRGRESDSDYDRVRSPSPRKERARYSRDGSASPRRERPRYSREHSPSPRRETLFYSRKHSASPRRERPRYSREHSASPQRERPRYSREHSANPQREKTSAENGRKPTPPGNVNLDHVSPVGEKGSLSPGEYRRSRSPYSRGAELERYDEEGSPAPGRQRSFSPLERERSRS
ncbi:RNA splicing factor [Lithospermum erythrorhizon]|uniref:RNA splicing factor n=1 Tax=Lithospermum erythrorhizon TaxID=34254 RepID=A0AAV3S0E4_LITER